MRAGPQRREVLRVQLDGRIGDVGQVDGRGDQLCVLLTLKAVPLTRHGGEVPGAAGAVAFVGAVLEDPAVVGVVDHGPAIWFPSRVDRPLLVERLVQALHPVARRRTDVRIDRRRDVHRGLVLVQFHPLFRHLVAAVDALHVQRVRRPDRQVELVPAGLGVGVHRWERGSFDGHLRGQWPAVTGPVSDVAGHGGRRGRLQGEVAGGGLPVGDGHPVRGAVGVAERGGHHVVLADLQRKRVRAVRGGVCHLVTDGDGGVRDGLAGVGIADRAGQRAMLPRLGEGRDAVGSAEPGGSVVPLGARAQVGASALSVVAGDDVVEGASCEVGERVRVLVGGRGTGERVGGGDEWGRGARPAHHLPAASTVGLVDGDAGLRVRYRGDVGDGPLGAVGVELDVGFFLVPRTATPGTAPDRLGPAAGVVRGAQCGAADRCDIRRCCGVGRAVPVITGAHGHRDAGVVVVGVGLGLLGELGPAVAVGHVVGAEVDRGLHGLAEFVDVGAVGLHEKDVAVRAGRGDHVQVQRDLSRPSGVRGGVVLPAALVDLAEAAVLRRTRG